MSGALATTKADEILAQGVEQGQNETAALFGYLLQQGRSDDAKKASANKEFLRGLLLEFKNNEAGVAKA